MLIDYVRKLNDFLEMEWTEDDMEGIEEWYLIQQLSTYIYDNYKHGEDDMVHCLRDIKETFPEYYIQSMEGFLLGNHDT